MPKFVYKILALINLRCLITPHRTNRECESVEILNDRLLTLPYFVSCLNFLALNSPLFWLQRVVFSL